MQKVNKNQTSKVARNLAGSLIVQLKTKYMPIFKNILARLQYFQFLNLNILNSSNSSSMSVYKIE